MFSPKFVPLLVLVLLLVGCSAVKAPTVTVPASEAIYMLPQARPDDTIRDRLITQLTIDPQDPILHRDLGSLLQSRVMRVAPPERWDMIRKAIDHLELAHARMPDDPQTQVFLGLAKASSARLPETNIFARMTRVLEGFSLIDKAVEAYPGNFSLRLIRAKAELAAPAILGRGKQLREDFQLLEERITGDQQLPEHLVALGFMFMGDFHHAKKEAEKARDYWLRAHNLDTSYRQEARDRMDGVEIQF